MLLSMRKVTAPDQAAWEVSVDWTGHPVRLPHAYRDRRRSKRGRSDGSSGDGGASLLPWDLPDLGDDFAVASIAVLAFIVAGVLLWFVIWPLLALAAELLIVVLIALAGTLGRLCFGRPWVIEAVSATGTEQRWQVRGMPGARRTIDQISEHIAAGIEPQPNEAMPVNAQTTLA